MKLVLRFSRGLLLVLALIGSVQAQPGTQTEKEKVPVIDGAAGPCVLDLTIVGPDGKPVYGATVKVHIAYGFGGFRKLDLQAGTNSDGKVKFTGLPDRVRRPPLEFEGSKDDLQGIVTDDPSSECQAKHDLRLTKPSAAPPQ